MIRDGLPDDTSRRRFLQGGALATLGSVFSIVPPALAAKGLHNKVGHETAPFEIVTTQTIQPTEQLIDLASPLVDRLAKEGFAPDLTATRSLVRYRDGHPEVRAFRQIGGWQEQGSRQAVVLAGAVKGFEAAQASILTWSGRRLTRMQLFRPHENAVAEYSVRRAAAGLETTSNLTRLPATEKNASKAIFKLLDHRGPRRAQADPLEVDNGDPVQDALDTACRVCRDTVIAAKAAGCVWALFACADSCVIPVVCAECFIVAYNVCEGAPDNLGCLLCTSFHLCKCPCGSYC